MMVSHIDDDHIAGLLELAQHLNSRRERREPLPWKIRRFWHNSFDDILANDDLKVASAASAMSTASLGEPLKPESDGAMILASVKQGRDLRAAIAYAEHIFKQTGSILLTTIHKAKGLEWSNVIHLDPWLVRKDPTVQNKNLDYVASVKLRELSVFLTVLVFHSLILLRLKLNGDENERGSIRVFHYSLGNG